MPKSAQSQHRNYIPSQNKPLEEAKIKRREQRKQDVKRGFVGIGNKCGVITSSGKPCKNRAGAGTNHVGQGHCRWHGGNLPTVRKAILAAEARLMGCPIDMNPVEAMIWCIRMTAGEIKWLSDQIAEIDNEEDWVEDTVVGRQMNIFVRERTAAQHRLFKFSSEAVKLGLAERAIKLAEQYGETIARFMHGVLDDLELTQHQMQLAKQSVRKHLILLEGGKAVKHEDIEAVAELSAS